MISVRIELTLPSRAPKADPKLAIIEHVHPIPVDQLRRVGCTETGRCA